MIGGLVLLGNNAKTLSRGKIASGSRSACDWYEFR